MNNTTAIARSNPTISYYGLTKAEGITISSAFIVACFFIKMTLNSSTDLN